MSRSFLLFPQSLKEMRPGVNGQCWVVETQNANSSGPVECAGGQAGVCGKLVLPARLCLQLGHR